MALSTALACSSDGYIGQDLSREWTPERFRHGTATVYHGVSDQNQAGLTDEDGTTSDWIEITIGRTQPSIWVDIISLSIAAASRRAGHSQAAPRRRLSGGVCHGKNRAVAGKPLHTTPAFQWNRASSCTQSGGAYLALTSPSGDALPRFGIRTLVGRPICPMDF